MNQAFTPTANVARFEFQGWNKKIFNWVFIDEFNIQQYCFEKWKLLVAGERLKIESKHEKPTDEAIQCPMVFISNINPPVEKVGFENRVLIVKATNGYGNFLN